MTEQPTTIHEHTDECHLTDAEVEEVQAVLEADSPEARGVITYLSIEDARFPDVDPSTHLHVRLVGTPGSSANRIIVHSCGVARFPAIPFPIPSTHYVGMSPADARLMAEALLAAADDAELAVPESDFDAELAELIARRDEGDLS